MKKLGVLGAALIGFGTGIYFGTSSANSYATVKTYLETNPDISDRLVYDSIKVAIREDIPFSNRSINAMSDALELPREDNGLLRNVENEAEEFLQGLKKTKAYQEFHNFEERMEELVR